MITAIIPTHDRSVFGYSLLPLAIVGLYRQICSDWNAIIVYDPDTSSKVHDIAIGEADRLAKSIGIVAHPERINAMVVSSSKLWDKRNRGMDAADGDIVCQVDDDDIYLPEYFSEMAAYYTDSGRSVCNTARLLCYDLQNMRRGDDGQNGSACHSCRSQTKYRYGQWVGDERFGEDSVYNQAVIDDGVNELNRTAPDSMGRQIIVCRYGVGHSWPWNYHYVTRTEDPNAVWFRGLVGPLADRYLELGKWNAPRMRPRSPVVARCGDCLKIGRTRGLSVCNATGGYLRSMTACPENRWNGPPAVTGSQSHAVARRRQACKRCENYTLYGTEDVGDNGKCSMLCDGGCAKSWAAALESGRWPVGSGCLQAAESRPRVHYAGMWSELTADVERDGLLADLAGRTRVPWIIPSTPDSCDVFLSGNQWHTLPTGARCYDWIYESIGHWKTPERFEQVYSGPRPGAVAQFVSNPLYADRPGNSLVPMPGYFEWQRQSENHTQRTLLTGIISNPNIYGLDTNKLGIATAIAECRQSPNEFRVVGRVCGVPVPGYWWNTPEIYADAEFALVLENVHHSTYSMGYLTEKFYQACIGGAVPCYLGAWNIEQLVPDGCYIDLRPFVGRWNQLLPFLRNQAAALYLRNIRAWMATPEYKTRSYESVLLKIDGVIYAAA